MKVPKIHLSRKLMLIVGGVLVTLGGTGAAAVYIGADKLLGPSYAELNGLECTEVKTVKIQKKDRFWVRKFITTNEPGDGLARVKTALRVAKTLQETNKADLVQVVVLDANGPKDRSGMRGRAVGADVIYVPDPHHVPADVAARVLTARYADGLAAPNGEFFGERVDMLEADIQGLVAKLNDQTDCVTPEVVVPEGEGHGEAAGGHGEAAGGHGEAPAHGAEDAHGEKPAEGHGETDGHGDAPAGEHGEDTPVAEHGAEESKGWMASLMGMVGLGGEEAPADGHAAPADGHAAPADGHAAPADGHAAPADGHAAPADGHAAPADDHAAPADGHAASADGHAAPADDHAAPADGHGAAAEGHDAPAEDHAEPAAAAHGDAGSVDTHGEAAHEAAGGDHAATAPAQHGAEPAADPAHAEAPAHATEPAAHAEETPAGVEDAAHGADASGHDSAGDQAQGHAAATEEAPAESAAAADEGWFSSLKSMVGLGGSEEDASAEDAAAEAEPASAPEGAPSTDHGAAWLEKMRAQPITPEGGAAAQPAAKPEEHGAATDAHRPAENQAILPPDAKANGDEHAKADH